jgi:hypothetical protein
VAAHNLPTSEILRKLKTLGYFGTKKWSEIKDISGDRLARAITEFQTFHGLEPDGIVGPKTANRMLRRRCGLPDFEMRLGDSICRWPMHKVTYYSSLTLPGINKQQAAQAYDIACQQWMEVCDLTLVRLTNGKQANIYAVSGTGRANGLDNRGGTLAWSELPCDVDAYKQLEQMFDEAEDWSFEMAIAVICHELGHALGLPHLAKGNLMAPYYDANIRKPQRGDVVEIVSRYGKRQAPAPTPDPAPVPAPGGVPLDINVSGTILINNQPYVLVPR